MRDVIIETKNLCKQYKDMAALVNVNLKVNKGDIYGLIGQNGAGKTTLLRIITALCAPTRGEVLLFGSQQGKAYISSLKRVGAVIETPALYPAMTAHENLEIQRRQKGIPDDNCIHRVLELAGLPDTKKKKAKDFSLGMRQRLGIAIALIGDPELLILDEPTNGLDPMGIIAMREMILQINRERKTTIIISSHILSELQQLATQYGILHKGKMVEQLSAKELNEKCGTYLSIRVDDTNLAVTTLERVLIDGNFEVMPDGLIKLYNHLGDIKYISKALTQAGSVILQFVKAEDTLESYYARLIGGVGND